MAEITLAKGTNPYAVEKFILDCEKYGTHIHSMQIIKGSEPLLRMCFEPYGFDDRMHIYSLSKSFVSVAVGICIDEGLLSLDERMTELFPEYMPENISENLRKLTLSDLLSMQSGHKACALDKMKNAENSIKAFFDSPFENEPGTTFVYSTGASCVCAAAVERATGRKIVDFLYEKLFEPLDIEKPVWAECDDGQTVGGAGLYVSSNDVTKFGMMLKNKGVYNGKRIVSAEYLKNATSRHSVDKDNGAPDWTAGYGYQFWMNSRGGFRGDGAFGQYCLVFPEKDVLVTLLCESADMPKEFELIYDLLDGIESDISSDMGYLLTAHKTLYATKPYEGEEKDVTFDVKENVCSVNSVRLYGNKVLHAVLSTDYGEKEIACGNGTYIGNRVLLKGFSPTIGLLDPDYGRVEQVNVFAAFEIEDGGKIVITLRHIDTPHCQKWTFDTKAGKWTVFTLTGDIPCREFDISKRKEEENA